MTKPKPAILPELCEAANNAIISAISGAVGQALVAQKEDLAAAIREIGASISDRLKAEGKRAGQRKGVDQ